MMRRSALFFDGLVFNVVEGRDQDADAIPVADRQRIELHGEARSIVFSCEGHANLTPVSRAIASFGADVESDFPLLGLPSAGTFTDTAHRHFSTRHYCHSESYHVVELAHYQLCRSMWTPTGKAGVRIAQIFMLITQAQLHELFYYEEVTRHLYWKRGPFKNKMAGSIAHDGRRMVQIFGLTFFYHRIVFEYFNGPIPDGMEIDHIDHHTWNNDPANLRAVPHSQNQKNLKLFKNNSSGIAGVNWSKEKRAWRARINNAGREIFLGYFTDKADALAAKKNAETLYGFHPNHGRPDVTMNRSQSVKGESDGYSTVH